VKLGQGKAILEVRGQSLFRHKVCRVILEVKIGGVKKNEQDAGTETGDDPSNTHTNESGMALYSL
jgi:hypothetical protein